MPRKRRRSAGGPPRGRSVEDVLYPSLDLHGHTAGEARARAERWLLEQQAAGERVVRLITGRGLHSVGPPVLPVEIAELLRRLKGSTVAAFGTEPGGGAFRVELRRDARKTALGRPPAPNRVRRVDPELRRLAEEALVELGVQATPELLEIEIQRLLREREST
jgi:hypothetical protein